MDNVFQRLNYKDLKNARLVCKLREKESIKYWRERATLVLVDSKKNKDEIGNYLALDKFFDFAKKSTGGAGSHYKFQEKPFQRYKLQSWKFNESLAENYTWFLDKFGRTIKHIHFHSCSFYTKTQFFSIVKNLANLESIVLPNVDFKKYENKYMWSMWGSASAHHGVKYFEVPSRWDNPADFWRFLRAFPNVTHVTIKNQDKFMSTGTSDPTILLDKELNELSSYCYYRKSKIQSLDLMDFFVKAAEKENETRSRVYGDEAMNFPLLNLSIDMSCRNHEETKNSIQNITQTLEVLKMFRLPIVSPFKKSLPFAGTMIALRELYLWGNLTKSFDFLQFTPNLKVLVMNLSCYEQKHKLEKTLGMRKLYLDPFQGDPVIETETVGIRVHGKIKKLKKRSKITLKHLEYLDTDYNLSPESLPVLAIWMPNLKTLKMILKKETVPVVCKQWPNLLCLEGLFESNLQNDDLVPLLQLKALSEFKLNAYCNQAKLSDVCAYSVFLRMKSLDKLNICVGKKMRMKAELALGEQIRELNIIRNYDKHRCECCSRMKFKLRSLGPKKSNQGHAVCRV